jgi:hypothetical protein
VKTDKNQIPLILYESDLQGFCETYLHDNGIQFFHIPDKFWHWVHKNTSTGIRCWLYKIFGGLPDMMVFFPINDTFMLAVNVELKRPGSYLRTAQKEAAVRLPWVTCKTLEDVDRVLTEARDFVEQLNHI